MIIATNNPFPCDPDEDLTGFLQKDGYTGTAQDLADEIENKVDKITGKGLSTEDYTTQHKVIVENLPLTNKIVTETGFSLLALDFTINAAWQWILNNVSYTNPADVVIEIPLCASDKSRIDYIVPNTSNGFTLVSGDETTGIPTAPSIPNKGMYVSWFVVTDTLIEDPNNPNLDSIPSLEDVINVFPFSTKGFTIQEKLSDESSNSGFHPTPRFLSLWNWLSGVTKYGKIKWDNIGVNVTFQLPTTADDSTETFAMVSDVEALETSIEGALDLKIDKGTYTGDAQDLKNDIDTKLDASSYNQYFKGVYLTEAALISAHPTGNAGEYAQVNAVGATAVVNYNWDVEAEAWIENVTTGGSGAANTDELPEGSTNLYWTVARFLANLTYANVIAALGFTPSTAPNDAQKNSDITKAEIEAKLTGVITTHTHPSSGGAPTEAQIATINHAATAKIVLVDADEVTGQNSATSFSLIRTVWSDVWTYIRGKATADNSFMIKPVTETGASFPLTDAYNGKVVILTGSCTVTIPNGLIAGFEVSLITLAGVTLTVALGGSVVLFNNVGLTMAEKLSCTIKNRTATNNYITAGSL